MEPISVCSLLHRVVFVVSWLGLSTGALAENFSTDFEGLPDVNPNAGTFTEFAGTLSVRFEGGTRFTAGIGDLYRNGSRKSWMIDPAPINDSTG
ncbi:MAG: hypothetical protein OEN20_05800, partial [Gammaproteobacteria bacterium]|nr:hypothetical protein [Gammaproteobacteria bacterium]